LTPGVGRLDARGQEAANRELVDGKLQDPWHLCHQLEAAEGVDDAAVGARAVHGCGHAEATVPALDRVDLRTDTEASNARPSHR
jgi:hypothetical protein